MFILIIRNETFIKDVIKSYGAGIEIWTGSEYNIMRLNNTVLKKRNRIHSLYSELNITLTHTPTDVVMETIQSE